MESMRSSRILFGAAMFAFAVFSTTDISAQTSSSSSASANSSVHKQSKNASASLDPGSVSNGVYRNKTLGFTCKIPPGWVLRTDEMNAQDSAADPPSGDSTQPQRAQGSAEGSKVLLAAFSRPPAAAGEEVNSSILIVAESAAAYPGLKEAVQYFDPLTEVAKAQGFTVDEDPYEVAIDTKTLVRGDFHKDVASRVMRQSTLAMLSHGYAVSITVIAGSADDVEDLIDGLDFAAPAGTKK
jgi:hypothetical protein